MKRFPPKRIVVAADLSAPSLSALDAAKALARRWQACLEIVHVQHEPFVAVGAAMEGMALPVPPSSPSDERRLREKLRRAAAGFPEDRLSVRSIHGWPPNELAELARPGDADMVVIGSHGYAGLDRFSFGSVSEAVVRRARVPVLVVHERRAPVRLTRVLTPWNGQPYATRALRYARELARSLKAELHVLRIVEPGRSLEKECADLRRRLESILGPGPDWTLRVRVGDARGHIIHEADSGRYGLIVLSAHRKTFSSDIVLGATVERVLRHSRIPVLAIPSGKAPARLRASRPAAWAAGKIFSA